MPYTLTRGTAAHRSVRPGRPWNIPGDRVMKGFPFSCLGCREKRDERRHGRRDVGYEFLAAEDVNLSITSPTRRR